FRSSVASNERASRIPGLSTSGKLCGGVSGRGRHGVDLANVVNTVQPMERDPLRYGERPEYWMRERARSARPWTSETTTEPECHRKSHPDAGAIHRWIV